MFASSQEFVSSGVSAAVIGPQVSSVHGFESSQVSGVPA